MRGKTTQFFARFPTGGAHFRGTNQKYAFVAGKQASPLGNRSKKSGRFLRPSLFILAVNPVTNEHDSDHREYNTWLTQEKNTDAWKKDPIFDWFPSAGAHFRGTNQKSTFVA